MPSAHSRTLKPDATCSHASPHSSSSAPQASCSSSLSPRLKPCRRHTDCPFSPHRAFKTITYTTPRQPSPRSGPGPVPHIAGVASHCFQDIPFTLSYVFLIPLSLRTSALPLSISLSTWSSDTGRRRSLYSLVAFLDFLLPGLGPGGHHSTPFK